MGESSIPLLTHKLGMSSIEPHRTSSLRKHSLGEKSFPRKKKVHYVADTDEDMDQSSDLSDTEQQGNIYKCSYDDSLAQPDYDPTDALFASVSVAADPQVLGQTNYPLSSFAA